MSPWRPRSLTIPPDSLQGWLRFAGWEMWMGMLVAVTVGIGMLLIVTASNRIVAVADLSNCYAPPPVTLPCERIVYRGGALNAAFSVLCGLTMMGVGTWFLWELWTAVAPKPITDDFLKMLDDSFARNWRNPLTWPWGRVLYAYGFTLLGATMTAGVAVMIWTLAVLPVSRKAPTVRVDTSQSFRLGQ
jgi:hypothetical protein